MKFEDLSNPFLIHFLRYFENKFIQNIKLHIHDLKHGQIKLISARVIIDDIQIKDWNHFKKRLKNVMGLSSATLMIKTTSDIQSIKHSLMERLELILGNIFDG